MGVQASTCTVLTPSLFRNEMSCCKAKVECGICSENMAAEYGFLNLHGLEMEPSTT
ncbi:hypothetical protein DAI22_01g085608 [Oryza sativa Japonica Group]|nr:hypothetical protein DAI22_01g085608 [Oryza sativa Japonica Group]